MVGCSGRAGARHFVLGHYYCLWLLSHKGRTFVVQTSSEKNRFEDLERSVVEIVCNGTPHPF